MTLCIDGHDFHYEMENLCRLFFPDEKIKVTSEPRHGKTEDETFVYTGLSKKNTGTLILAYVETESKKEKDSVFLSNKEASGQHELERSMGVLLFSLLVKICGYRPAWGILTGVRPVKLFGNIFEEVGGPAAIEYFENKFLVSNKKAELAMAVYKNEREILTNVSPDSFSLYIGIPFCPTRCAYCSFVSSSVDKTFRLIPKYVDLLRGEIEHTAEIAASLGLRLMSVYIGGGTPTTLTAAQLASVLGTVKSSFDMSSCREITVEAGRPDTITEEKLDSMKKSGVSRISINPQTLNDDVLRAIGRGHTTEQTLTAFRLARKYGFCNINMDIIAGLPHDDIKSFQNTVDGLISLSPENITVHTLALKRAAKLFQDKCKGKHSCADAGAAGDMIEYSDTVLQNSGYKPYYLYRQSRMAGNLENTGWAKPGFENLYNVITMEEKQTILACGSGAVTKLKDPYSDNLKRIFNFKYPYEYINRYEEIIVRKDLVKKCYGEFRK